MLTSSIPAATPFSHDSTNTAKAATVEASARTAFFARLRDEAANDHHAATATAATLAARAAASQVPDPMSSLSTVAVAGAMNSLPAALNMMRSIAMASAAGTLSEADRQTLQSEYAQLTHQVTSSVGSVSAAQEAQTSADRDNARRDEADKTRFQDSDDHRTTLTQTTQVPQETVQYPPVERTSTVQKQTLVEDGHAMQKDPRVDFRTHELHVGNDSYEPVAIRQTLEHPTLPETFGRVEIHAETQHSFVAHAAHITQFVQVAQTEHVAPIVAIA